jgi:apolipoprotein D and lipocalin family protein
VTLALVLFLGGCAGDGQRASVFRAPETPIWSAAGFAPGQIAGTWRQVAGFAESPGGCRGGGLEITPAGAGLAMKGTLCLDGKAEAIDALARPVGPGRLAVAGEDDWWVLWVDSGYRTLAVGTPSGRFGFVLDRGAIAPDRLTAAREVFDFNGYVSGALRAF